MKRIVLIVFILAVIITAGTVTGCGSREVQKPPDQITVQLKWVHQAQFAGIYAADKKGFYAEENIDITLKAGGLDIPPSKMIDDIISGESTFALVGGDHVITFRSQDKPIVAISVIFQKNPYAYMSLKGSGIERPQDLVGKKIMISSQGVTHHLALLQKLSIDPDALEEIPYEYDIRPLVTGQIDVHMAYNTGLGVDFDLAGYELDCMWVDDYGIRLYADTLVATEQLIQQNPDLVERFLRATLEGWRYAIENPDEAVDIALQYDTKLDRNQQLLKMQAMLPLIHTGAIQLGWMQAEVWEGMHQILLEQGPLDEPVDIDEVYTMQFLDKIYVNGE